MLGMNLVTYSCPRENFQVKNGFHLRAYNKELLLTAQLLSDLVMLAACIHFNFLARLSNKKIFLAATSITFT